MPNRLIYEELSRIEADSSFDFHTLSLAGTGLTDHDLRPLVTTLTQLHFIKHLSLQNNKLKDTKIIRILLNDHSSLQTLDLTGNEYLSNKLDKLDKRSVVVKY